MLNRFFDMIFRKNTVLFSYISVLLAVLIIPTVFGCIVSSYSMGAAMEQINIRTQESANHIRITLDTEISAAMQAAVTVANNSSLHSLAIKSPGKDFAFDVSKNSFSSTAKTIPGIYKLFIYFDDADTIIDDTSLYDPDAYIKEVLNTTDIAPEDYTHIITMSKKANILPAQTFGPANSQTNHKCITYVQPFPLKGNPKGQVVVLIDCDKIFAPFKKDFESGDTCFYIVNDKNQLIFSIGNGDYIAPESDFSDKDRRTSKINGQNITYQVEQSDFASLKYVYAYSDASAEKSVFPLKLSITLYALLVIIFGTVLIVWLAHRNTKPLRELSGLIDKSYGSDAGKNEFENLNVAIKNILNEKLRLSSVLEAGESSLKKDTISSILRGGSMNTDSVLLECKNNGIEFVSDNFCVAYFNLDDITSPDMPIIKYAISNTVSEIFAPIAEVFIDDSENTSLSVIINPRSLADETQDQILSHLAFLRTFFLEQFSATVNVGVGDMVSGIKSVPSSYSNAKEAAEYSALTGASDVMPYDKIKTKDYYYFYPLETEGKLLASVMNGDIWQVKQIIDQVVEANSMLSLDMSRCLFFDLTATALKVMSNKTIDLSAIFGDSDSPFTRLMQCKSIKDLIDTIHVIFEKICMQITDSHSVKKEKLKVTITDFVKRNYTNPNMSLAMVADEFAMNYTYMSHFFKDYIGANFIDYISDLRVKKAAELLRTTNLAIGDIATEVGYANATVLIKIFKKVTDTTPGAYRKSTREENK